MELFSIRIQRTFQLVSTKNGCLHALYFRIHILNMMLTFGGSLMLSRGRKNWVLSLKSCLLKQNRQNTKIKVGYGALYLVSFIMIYDRICQPEVCKFVYSSAFSLKSIRLSGQFFTRVRKHAFTRISAQDYTYVCADLCGCMWNLLYNNYIRFKNNYANLIQ